MNTRPHGVPSLIPLPPGDVPTEFRCLQVIIPDSDAYAQELVGLVARAAQWVSYQREPTHKATLIAEAWRLALLQTDNFAACGGETMQLRECQTGCGIEYSTDGGANWTCIDLAGCIETIWDEKLAGAFDDGVLGQGVEQQGPQDRPAVDTCHTYHVKLDAKEMWRVPSVLRTGDFLQVTNARGGWSDGGIVWRCPDGNIYGFGACVNGTTELIGSDPMPNKPHMQIIAKIGTSYFDPMANGYTIPSPTPQSAVYLMANDADMVGHFGSVEFDVEVCSGEAVEWCYEYDFTAGKQGWDLKPNPQTGVIYGQYVAGHGWQTDVHELCWIRTDNLQGPITISHIEAEMEQVSGDRYYFNFGFHPAAYKSVTASVVTTPQTLGADWATTSNDQIYWWVQLSLTTGSNTLRKLRFYGNQTSNPFGEDNCSN